ncbi:MAG TPA: AAA family ATPase [Candidatus Moranbacteria bacterium]|nr:AAA family ATPase [Candidatus Moranbacteria bacterium]HRY28111.1 AAA family ATPase [Candidatus Moranbacteria bacterium]HSA08276.1 AAA family ATPase [Candidatus Moranbacteria bacterium]
MLFLGNQKVTNLLKKSQGSGNISHAYIFSGPEHVGKFTLAKMFALHLIEGSNLDLEMEKTSKDALLDLITIAPEITEKNGVAKQRDIPIESIRDAQKSLSLFPYHGKYKILIIDDAHKLNVAAQNALLKILEEPNPTTIIILVTSNEDKILPTVKSRCQIINFGLVDDAEMLEFFPQNLVSLSAGRPGLAKIMGENEDEMVFRSEAVGNLNKIISGSLNERFSLAEQLSKDVSKTSDMLNCWLWEMRKKALVSEDSERKNVYAGMEKIQKSLETLKNTNANGRLVLETLFMDL